MMFYVAYTFGKTDVLSSFYVEKKGCSKSQTCLKRCSTSLTCLQKSCYKSVIWLKNTFYAAYMFEKNILTASFKGTEYMVLFVSHEITLPICLRSCTPRHF